MEQHTGNLEDFDNIVREILAYSIGSHHGLFDCVNKNHENGFIKRLEQIPPEDDEAIKNFLEFCSNKHELDELFEKSVEEIIPILKKCYDIANDNEEVCFLHGMLIRLMTSAVMEGDRRDTAMFCTDAQFPADATSELWDKLLDRAEEKLKLLPSDTEINIARKKISDICRKAAENEPGLYRLNVPTGAGKTLSSLRYALAHSKSYNKKRIIFTSPLLTITEQNSQIIRDYIGSEYILEHHSNIVQEIGATQEELEKYELLTDSWSSPIIITTLVQLLNTMFLEKTSSVRRFHTLSDAVIVIDEVQTVPYNMLTLFNLAITFLVEICNTTVLFCSATQPCLESIEHPILTEIKDIIPYDEAIFDVFKRTRIIDKDSYKLKEIPSLISEIMQTSSSLLIVCNKKSEAIKIFHDIQSEEYDVFHLSASMCTEHRKKTLRNIYDSLKTRDKKIICVSTQVIEAGVDISFEAVIRISAGMDSVIQSAGRCNRNMESPELSPVYIVQLLDEKLENLNDIKLAKRATEKLLFDYKISPEKYNYDLSSNVAIERYYRELFKIQKSENINYHDYSVEKNLTLLDLLSINIEWQNSKMALKQSKQFYFNQAFSSAGAYFKVFNDNTTDVIVPWNNGSDIITELSSAKAENDISYVRNLLDKARGYTVSLYSYQIKKLEEYGAIIPLANGIALGLDSSYYSLDTGVQTETESEVYDECKTQIW